MRDGPSVTPRTSECPTIEHMVRTAPTINARDCRVFLDATCGRAMYANWLTVPQVFAKYYSLNHTVLVRSEAL